MPGSVVSLCPLLRPGRRFLPPYGAQELMMNSMLSDYVSEMTIPSAGYFYSRRARYGRSALQECLRHSARTKTTRLSSARFFFSFFQASSAFSGFFPAYVELNSRLRIKQEKIKQIYKFLQARIHIHTLSVLTVGLVCLETQPPTPTLSLASPLSDHHLDDMELKQTVSRGRNEV